MKTKLLITGAVLALVQQALPLYAQQPVLLKNPTGKTVSQGDETDGLKVQVTKIAAGAGLATAAKQDTGNASLASIDTKMTSQATAAKQDTQIANQTNGTQKAIAVPTQGAPTDRSGTITSGGTSQTLAAALATRIYIEIQNVSDTDMYLNFGAAAVADSNSFLLKANGGTYVNPAHYCPTGTITVIGATTGKKFVAKEG